MAKRSRRESITSPSDQQDSPTPTPEPELDSSSSDPGASSSLPTKYTQLDSSSSFDTHDVMRCSLAPHKEPISFASYEEYEVHYIQAHVNRCSECGRNFPTELFLSLHIEENHDPLVEARKERGERTYGCFVEVGEASSSPHPSLAPGKPQPKNGKKFRSLPHSHINPRVTQTYNFYIVNDGIDKHKSMLRPGSHNTYTHHPHGHGRRVSLSTPSSAPPGGGSPPHEVGRMRRRKFSQSTASASVATKEKEKEGMPPVANSGKVRAQSTAVPGGAAQTQSSSTGNDMADLERSMAALKFVPPSVTSKAARGKSGQ
ncbi:hypothetical protein FQN54_007528 [Arachnomyces sp. PD_36]|nr:hypothetical protein FQN54_007528 [Arachnomyces sp. PD_36]